MRTRPALPLMAVLVAVLLLAGACSSGSKKTTTSTTSATTSQSSKSGSSGSTLSTTKSTDTNQSFSGSSNSAFCSTFKKYDSYFSNNTDESNNAKKVIAALNDLKKNAPSELKGDVQNLIDYLQEIESIGTDNLSGLDSLESGSVGQKAEASGTRLDDYVSQVCGINVSS